MDLALQVLVGLATLMLLGLGTMSMFAPRRMVKNFAIAVLRTNEQKIIEIKVRLLELAMPVRSWSTAERVCIASGSSV